MKTLFQPLFIGFYGRYASHFLRRRTAVLVPVLVACWLSQGSIASAQTWTSHGPEGGTIEPLAIYRFDRTTILYAGTDLGGVFKSTDTDGGVSWSAANTGLTNPTIRFLRTQMDCAETPDGPTCQVREPDAVHAFLAAAHDQQILVHALRGFCLLASVFLSRAASPGGRRSAICHSA